MLDAYWQTLCTGMALEDGFEAGKNAFASFDDWEVLSGWPNTLFLDMLGLDYYNWPYKLLSFVTGFMIGLSGTNKPQEITFLGMIVAS